MSQKTPFRCHVFVCVNDRDGARKSCADNQGAEIRRIPKERFNKMSLPPDSVRVSQSLCMGLCSEGPNLMIYPQGIWFSSVRMEDINDIVEKVQEFLAEE